MRLSAGGRVRGGALRSSAGRPWRLLLEPDAPTGSEVSEIGSALEARILPPALPGAVNMAVDELVFATAREGGAPTLRFYRWAPACLSLGRNQPARGRLRADLLEEWGLDVVRRPTGGLAVLHDREITYSVAVPVGEIGSPRETYRRLNEALGAGLRRLGVAAEIAVRPEAAPGGPSLSYLADAGLEARCFRSLAPGELGALGRKLVGSAQRCENRTLLQHGSLLLDGDQDRVPALLGAGPGQADAVEPTSLRGILGSAPALERVIAALVDGFREVLGIPLAAGGLFPEERARLADTAARYRSAAWTLRR